MNTFALSALVLVGYVHLLFVLSLLKKRNDVADVAWGPGFVLLALTSLVTAGAVTSLSVAVSLLVTIWGLRLGLHIYRRNRSKPEDYRYAEWRKRWGRWFVVRSYAQVYLLQGALLYLIAIPVLLINTSPSASWNPLTFSGLALGLAGLILEAISDVQLSRFRRNPANRGKLMTTGLWAYSRHPNYFGEVLHWWGVWAMACAVPGGLASVLSPLLITFLILKISGIPLLEQKMQHHPQFAEYKARVSAFVPLPPKTKGEMPWTP